jgi:hypothetical protein
MTVLVGTSLVFRAGAQEKLGPKVPKGFDEAAATAWQKAGAQVGWMGKESGSPKFNIGPGEMKELMPAFSFNYPRFQEKFLVGLPDPGVPFGLEFGPTMTNAGLKQLAGLKSLKALRLGSTQVTDLGLKELAGLKNLQWLDLLYTKVTDAGLKELAGFKNLQSLGLCGTKVTNAGLKHLAGLKNLRTLDLQLTNVTDAGLAKLEKVLPACEIRR